MRVHPALALSVSLPFAAAPLAVPDAPGPVAGRPAAAPAAVVVEAPSGAVVTDADLLDRLARLDAVYAGEKHDDALHHGVQLELLKGLHARRPGLVLGLEMADREQQGELDAWASGRMSDADFEAFWKKAWGFDFALYAPLLRYAKANGVRVVGLNAPRPLVSKVYRGGLAALTPADRARLPAAIAQTADPDYLAYITEAIRESHGNPPPAALAKMLEAQAVWNETMGQGVADALAAGADLVLVVAGSGHMVFRGGVPESAARRRALAQAVVLPWPDAGGRAPLPDMLRELRDPARALLKRADYFWLLAQ